MQALKGIYPQLENANERKDITVLLYRKYAKSAVPFVLYPISNTQHIQMKGIFIF